MRTDAEIGTAQFRPHTAEVKAKAMPKRLAAKAYPTSGASSSDAGAAAKAKAKIETYTSGSASQLGHAGAAIWFCTEDRDYRDTNVRTRYWMEREGEMVLLSVMQGPAGNTADVSTWQQ